MKVSRAPRAHVETVVADGQDRGRPEQAMVRQGLTRGAPSGCQMSSPGRLFTFRSFGIAGNSRCFDVTSRIASGLVKVC